MPIVNPVVTPRTTRVFGVPAPEKLRAALVRVGQVPHITWTMTGGDGAALDLSDAAGAGVVPVTLRIAGATASSSSPLEVQGTAVDAAAGLVAADVDLTRFAAPGIYDAEFAVADAAGVTLASNRFLLVVERSLYGGDGSGPPTIAEVRLHLRDSSPAENHLIDAVTFDDAEIAAAITRPVDYWNEALPPLDVTYDTTNFPFRFHWLEGIKASLYWVAAEYYRKNHLAYQAAGVSVDDLNKAQEYEQKAQALWDEFKAWVQQRKISLNIDAGYGVEFSPYAYYSNGWYPNT